MKSSLYKITIAILIAAFLGSSAYGQSQQDDVLNFYVQRAAAVYDSRNPIERGVVFAYTATTVRENLDSDSEVTTVDSVKTRYYYSFGELDSQVTVVPQTGDVGAIDMTIPNVMADDYVFNFYPNDAGDSDLAIGFDTPTLESGLPVGFAVIDRDLFLVRSLHMSYPNREGFARYSRSVETTVVEGLVFPLELVVMAGIRVYQM